MEGRTAASVAVLVLGISLFAAGAQAQVTVLLNGTATAATQTYNNQQITVSVTAPTSTVTKTKDVIALYPAASSNPALNPSYKYQALTYTTSGSNSIASVTFTVPNIRQNITVLYLQGTALVVPLPASPKVFSVLNGTVAGSNTILNANPNQPTQVHLALTSSISTMSVTWTTGPTPQPQFVQFGTAPGVYGPPVPATLTTTYTPNALCGTFVSTFAFLDPGVFSTANMTGLLPATKYYYRVGTLTSALTTSQEYFFTTPPVTGPSSTVKVILSADMSVADNFGALLPDGSDSPLNTAAGIAAEVQSNGYTLTLMSGDLAYADGFASYWDVFMDQIQQFTAYSPFQVVDGNHERDWPQSGDNFGPHPGNQLPQGPNGICPYTNDASGQMPFVACDSQGECGSITAARFNTMQYPAITPGIPETSGFVKTKYYSYNYGPIHFVAYSSEEPFGPGTPQYQFVVSDLAAVNRSVTPWVVVTAHRPMYADSTDFTGLPDPSTNFTIATATFNETDGDQFVAFEQRAAFEQVFNQYGVDLFYNGHKHISYRTCPVYQCNCATTRRADGSISGTVYVTGGNAGRSLANPAKQLIELNPAYSPFVNLTCANNGTKSVDVFDAAVGGYHVNVSTTAYGYYRLTANATVLTVQSMNVTTLPATPFIDASATFTLTRFPPPAPSTAPPVSTAAPSTKPAAPPTTGAPATSAPVATTPAPVVPSPPPVTNKIDAIINGVDNLPLDVGNAGVAVANHIVG